MATVRWIGAAAGVKQVSTLAISGTWTAGDTITLKINNIDFTLTVGSTVTTTTIATSLKQAFNGETLTDATYSYAPSLASGAQSIGVFTEATASVSSSTVTFTGVTAGVPFTMTASRVTASSGAISFSNVTAATGPNFWDNVDNWDSNSLPVDNDTIVFDSGNVDVLYGLTTGIQPAAVAITLGYTGKIGLPDMNTSASNQSNYYAEYRTKFLTFDDNSVTNTVTIGGGDGNGSGRIKIDFGAGQTTLNVIGTGPRAIPGEPALVVKGTHASNAFTVMGGDAGFAFAVGDSTTIATLRVGSDSSSSAKVTCGTSATLTTVVVSGGTLSISANCTTMTQYAGTISQAAGVPATLRVWAGTYESRGTGTIGTECTIGAKGKFDRSKDTRALTITPVIQLYAGATFLDPNSSITYTAGFKTNGCRLSDCAVDVGSNHTFTVA